MNRPRQAALAAAMTLVVFNAVAGGRGSPQALEPLARTAAASSAQPAAAAQVSNATLQVRPLGARYTATLPAGFDSIGKIYRDYDCAQGRPLCSR